MYYQRALVTGASSGIGAAIVRAFVAEGIEVLGVGLGEDHLNAVADETGCQMLHADVRDFETMTELINDFSPDILVNAAGVGHGITGLAEVSAPEIAEAMEINTIAPIQLTAAAVASLKENKGRGHIINIGSIAGLHTMISGLYGAGKASIHTFSQNMRVELKGFPIRITELCPGRVSSGFYQAARGNSDSLEAIASTGINELQPEDIANAAVFAIKAPLHVNVSTIELLPTEQVVGGVQVNPIPAL